MKLLIAVVNDTERIEEVLERFYEIGVTGATIVDSEGMGHVLSQDPPAFAGLQSLVARTRPQNTTLFSVIHDEATVARALEILEDVCGSFDGPATGVAFTVPVDRAIGVVHDRSGDGPPVDP